MKPISWLLTFMFALFTLQASAMNLKFMRDSALGKLKASDLEALRNDVRAALSDAPDGTIIEWQSPDKTLTAKVLLRSTYNQDGDTRCRRTVMKVSLGQAKPERYRFDLCLDGEMWQLSQTPVSLFTKHDWDYVAGIAQDALDNEIDGSPVSWYQRASRNSGVITPLSSFRHDGQDCRRVAISIISHQGNTSDATFNACRLDSGQWQRKIINGE